MPKFMIEVSHSDDHEACVRALQAIQTYGSHLMTHADWGCKDNHHACWLIAELDSREEAMRMVPPEFRSEARIVELNTFTRDEIAALVAGLDK